MPKYIALIKCVLDCPEDDIVKVNKALQDAEFEEEIGGVPREGITGIRVPSNRFYDMTFRELKDVRLLDYVKEES